MWGPRAEKKKVKSLRHVQLSATPWTVTYQVPLSLGILQARTLKWVAISLCPQFSAVCKKLLLEILYLSHTFRKCLNQSLRPGVSDSQSPHFISRLIATEWSQLKYHSDAKIFVISYKLQDSPEYLYRLLWQKRSKGIKVIWLFLITDRG